MDLRERAFANIALRLQLVSREQVEACSARVNGAPGTTFLQAAMGCGLISEDEAALVRGHAERMLHKRQAQPRAVHAPVRVEEERVERADRRANPSPAAPPANKPRRRAPRNWEATRAPDEGVVHVPRKAAAPPPRAETIPLEGALRPQAPPMELADTAPGATLEDEPRSRAVPTMAIGGPTREAAVPAPTEAAPVEGFPLAAPDEVARVELSQPPAAAAPAPAKPPPPPARAEPPAAARARRAPAAPARAEPPPPPARAEPHAPSRVQAQAGAEPHLPPADAQPAAESERPLKLAAQRPVAAIAPQDSYLGKALALAMRHGASDLHVHSGAPLLIRVDGQIRPLAAAPLSAEAAEKVIAEITTDAHWALLVKKGEVDFACEIPGLARFRVNVYRQQRGLDAVFRIIPLQPPTLEQLGLPARLARLTDFRTGMVLCTGPSGCGKSTTLAALLSNLVHTRADHILTVEDPVEYVFPPGRALVNQRQVGDHTSSFARALRAALREDPDIIAITELRDRETISLAISAAETGHLVLGTLHTGNAAQTIHRIVSSFPADEQEQVRVMLAESLRAVVSQRLVPMATGRGRVPAIELLVVNTAVSNLIREDKTHQLASVMQTGKAAGMVTLDDSLEELVGSGVVTAEAARRVAVKKERFA